MIKKISSLEQCLNPFCSLANLYFFVLEAVKIGEAIQWIGLRCFQTSLFCNKVNTTPKNYSVRFLAVSMWCIQWHTPTNSIKARTNMIKVCYRDPLWEFTIKFHLVRSSDCPERKGTIRSVSGGDREKIHGLEVSSSRSMHHPLSLHALLYNHNLGHYVSIHWTSFIIYRVKTKDHASVTTWNVLEPIHLPAQKLRKSNSSGQVQDKRGPPSSFNTKSSRLLF